MNEQNPENNPTAMEQIINSLEDEINRCADEIKEAQEPEKSELMDNMNTAYEEVYRLYIETEEVPKEKIIQILKIYANTANNYSGKEKQIKR